MQRDINSYFEGVLENVENILISSFYKDRDKKNLETVKTKITKWYDLYKENNTLKGIDPKELEYIALEITEFFDKYLVLESTKENYAERLSYDFGHLEISWKEEMLGSRENG